jgi:F420-dependent oxidoreductase-like protein
MRIGISLGEVPAAGRDAAGILAQARRAEADGFASGWFNSTAAWDAIVAAAIAGTVTERIELGTSVVPIQLRHPVALAQAALSAQAAAGGRFALGIGLSHGFALEGRFGLPARRSVGQMEEQLAVLTALAHTGKADHRGDFYQVSTELAVPGASPFPILVAALGPRMLALAGGRADGTITWMTGPRALAEHIAPRINEAAADAGRPPPRIVAGLPVAVTRDVAAARASAGHVFAVYGDVPSYRAMMDREGAEGPSDLAVIGDEDGVGGQLRRLEEAGATDLWAVPFRVRGDDEALERTRAFLIGLARRG